MKLGDVMLAAICGLVIVVSAVHINSNNSNSKPDIFSVFLFWFSWTVFGVIAYYMGFYTADLFYYLINNYAKYFGLMNAHTISQETNGVNSDGHYGKNGHEVIGKLFYEHIISQVYPTNRGTPPKISRFRQTRITILFFNIFY